MSLVNMSRAYEQMRFRLTLAVDQEQQLEELLAQWFIDSNEGARTFLREIALEYREKHPQGPIANAAQHGVGQQRQNGGTRHVASTLYAVPDVASEGIPAQGAGGEAGAGVSVGAGRGAVSGAAEPCS